MNTIATAALDVLCLHLPLPPDSLRTNARMGRHWGSVNKDKDGYKALCYLVVKGMKVKVAAYPVTLQVTAYLGKGQRCDPSDLGSWCKATIDSLVEVGLLRGDSAASVNPFVARVERDWKQPRLEVRITPVEVT